MTHQVDNHHILRPVLGALSQFAAKETVFPRIPASRPCPLHRFAHDRAISHPEKQFRGPGKDVSSFPQIEESSIGNRLDLSKPKVQGPRMNGSHIQEGLAEVDLVDISRGDIGLSLLDGLQVVLLGATESNLSR
jgi:hypothetical protein